MTDSLSRTSKLVIRSTWCCFYFALLLAAMTGCGKESAGLAVYGKVSYRDKPLPNAAVSFFPIKGRPVFAKVSHTGEYSADLLPGEYTVTVNAGVQLPAGYKEGDPVPPPPVELPPEYTTRAKSSLRATVLPSQSDPIDFVLQ